MAAHVPLPGSKRTLMPNSRPAGSINPAEITSVTVRVRSAGDPQSLVTKAYELANTPIAKRKYLTHEELEANHGASPGRPRQDRAFRAAARSDRRAARPSGRSCLKASSATCWRRFRPTSRCISTPAERIAAGAAKSPCRRSSPESLPACSASIRVRSIAIARVTSRPGKPRANGTRARQPPQARRPRRAWRPERRGGDRFRQALQFPGQFRRHRSDHRHHRTRRRLSQQRPAGVLPRDRRCGAEGRLHLGRPCRAIIRQRRIRPMAK